MSRRPVLLLVLCAGLWTGAAGVGARAQDALQLDARAATDWPAFLAEQDLRWSTLPSRWEEGAFTGNGHLGAMTFAEDGGRALIWQLGRNDVTDHRADQAEPILARPRLPIGQLRLLFAEPIEGFDGRLDLWNAELVGTLRTSRGDVSLRSYTHATQPAIVIELAGAAATDVRLVFRPDLALNERLLFRKMPIAEADLNPAPFVETIDGVTVSVQERRHGGEYAVAWRDVGGPGGVRAIVCSIADSHPGHAARREAAAAVTRAVGDGVDELRRTHRAWWHAYYPASFLTIPDRRLESFYWMQMYKLASATRADGLVVDTQGPWYRRTPWPGTWWNLNVQLSYWPVYTANRQEIAASLRRFLTRSRETLRANVPEPDRVGPGGARAAGIGRISGPDGVSPLDVRGPWTPASGAYELSNLVWVMHNVWLDWRHTGDDALLRDLLFPLLGESVQYLLHRLEPGDDGRLHLPEAISPEYPTTARDTNYDLALLRWGLRTLLDLDARLGAKSPQAAVWRDTLARLTDYPVGPDGYLIGRDVPYAVSHRHFSHLLMIYPLKLVTGERPGERALIERSLAHWIGKEGALQGYSFVGASAISSLLGDGEAAARFLRTLVDRFVKPNTMYLESGPVIETPLAAAQAIHEMLLQGHGGLLRVFPAVPASWRDVRFEALRAEGAFVVSATRAGGLATRVVVASLTGEPVRLRIGGAAPGLHPVSPRRGAVRRLSTGEWALALAPNESVTFTSTP